MDKNLINLPQKLKAAEEKRIARLQQVRDCFQIVMGTDAGRVVIGFLLSESRCFASGLKTVSNLQKCYNVGPEYFLGQADFGKNLLQFLTAEQVAEIIRDTQKGGTNE